MSVQEKEFSKRTPRQPFYSVYQPIIDVQHKRVMGYEALTRGRGRNKLPEEIFRRSYEDGLTIALNLECLNTAFQILPKLKKDQLLFVNVEPITMAQCFGPGLEADFLILKKLGPYRKQVVFELTEGMKVRDFKYVQAATKYLHKLGCKFAIDDVVGIGAKLYKLLSLKPDFVKIGMGVTRSIHNQSIGQALAQQIHQIATQYNAQIIAEGVELKPELKYVTNMGIRYIQGFYFGRPNPKLMTKVKKI